jgi:hypothetical protein
VPAAKNIKPRPATANDINAQEIRIESFFPADAATDTVFRQWAASA